MQLGYSPLIPFNLDGTCSRDPDADLKGADDPDLEYDFECYRDCESQPRHEEDSGLWKFIPWNDNSNPYSTSCNGTESNGLLVSTEGCFRPFMHRSGPLTFYSYSVWNSSDTSPIKAGEPINNVMIFL